MHADEDKITEAQDNFLLILHREFYEVQFYPKYVHQFLEGDTLFGSEPGIEEIADIVKGGAWNVKGTALLTIGGIDYKLCIQPHFIRGPNVFQIYQLQQYSSGLFYKYATHSMAFKCIPGMFSFEYLISKGKDVYREKYTKTDVTPITEIISSFYAWLDSIGLLYIYEKNWNVDNIQLLKKKDTSNF